MAKKRRIGLTVLLLALVAGAIWLTLWRRELALEGKSLPSWLWAIRQGHNQTMIPKGGMLEIGTNAIPELLRLVQARDTPLKKYVAAFLLRHGNPIPIRTSNSYQTMAVVGFMCLGPRGQPAVPQLIKLLHYPDPEVRLTAAGCLGHVGPGANAAIPNLMRLLDDTNLAARHTAMFALGAVGAEPQVVVPALVAQLNSTNRDLANVIVALSNWGTNAASAVPILRRMTVNTNLYSVGVRRRAADALKKISPEPAAAGGTKR